MFTGQEENVILQFENHLVDAVLDHLARDIFIVPDEPNYFTVRPDSIITRNSSPGYLASVKVLRSLGQQKTWWV